MLLVQGLHSENDGCLDTQLLVIWVFLDPVGCSGCFPIGVYTELVGTPKISLLTTQVLPSNRVLVFSSAIFSQPRLKLHFLLPFEVFLWYSQVPAVEFYSSFLQRMVGYSFLPADQPCATLFPILPELLLIKTGPRSSSVLPQRPLTPTQQSSNSRIWDF